MPVTYIPLDAWRSTKYGDNSAMAKMANGFAVRSKNDAEIKTANRDNQVLSIPDFIEGLSGHSAQDLTSDGVIYFSIAIAVFAIGIFIFVMTL